jgi:hypothetical protein
MPVENKISNFEVNEGWAEVQAPPKLFHIALKWLAQYVALIT